jgi:signal transduction histidine kinase
MNILSTAQLEHLLTVDFEAAEEYQVARNSPFARALASLPREKLLQVLEERNCVPGEYIVTEGDFGDAFYLIWSGQVMVFMGDPEAPTFLGYRSAGEIIGEMALLENKPRSASVVALTETRLLKISRDHFYNLIEGEPKIDLSIMGVLSARLRAADRERSRVETSEKHLTDQVAELQTEKQHLLDLQRLRQETTDFITHDLRTPLGSVAVALSMLEMVLPDPILEENQQLLNVAKLGCERMLRLVESMLEVSQIESGTFQLTREELDLSELAKAVVAGMLPGRMRSVCVETQMPEQLPKLFADREMLRRVFENLLDNALRYSPEGGEIQIITEAQPGQVLVKVTDLGPGVLPEDREWIFERFVRSGSDPRRRRGYGLGLAYCRLVVEAHGGRIWVEAGERATGSQFCFTLPLSR